MKFVYFTHSLTSCWNHGNAHFLRGVLRELQSGGHEVAVYEPKGAWSLANLLADHGEQGLQPFHEAYPELASTMFDETSGFERTLADADVVIVHEWNEPWVVAAIGDLRRRSGRFLLFFHDTHHRAVSDPQAIRRLDLSRYDAVLAFGATLVDAYRREGWGNRAFVWHEAADIRLFRPPAEEGHRRGLVWIGNWGDGERTAELETFLLRPAKAAGVGLDVYGVRYPVPALAMLAGYAARYRGWLPNPRVPSVFAQHFATIHVPRRFYVDRLPGIPTIRVFEALACGIPLICAPWEDIEGLFEPGRDYLVAHSEAEMERHLAAVRDDPDLRRSLVANGLAVIRQRHTCAHRAAELLAIATQLGSVRGLEMVA